MLKRIKRGLRNHPGIQIATMLVLIGGLSGVGRCDNGVDIVVDIWRVVVGALVMSVFWLPVLWTAWKAGGDHAD